MLPINVKQSAASATPAPASRRSVLAQGRSLTIRVALTPAADVRQGREGPAASQRPRARRGKRKAAVAAGHELGSAPAIAKDGAARGRRRRWKRKAGRVAAAVAVAAAAAAARDAAAGGRAQEAPPPCEGAACSPPLDDVLCELRGLCL